MNRQARRAAARTSNGSAGGGAAGKTNAALKMLSALEHQQAGRMAEAARVYDEMLAADPDNARLHFSHGAMLHAAGEHARAIDSYLRAMQLDPDMLDAHYNFCAALMALGQFEAAANYYEQLLTLKSDFVVGYSHMALAYHGAGKPQQALAAARRGLTIEETPSGKSTFVQALSGLREAPDADLHGLLVRAVSEPWSRPNELARHCAALFRNDPVIGPCIARARAAFPVRLSAADLFGPDGLQALSQDALMRAFLENSRIAMLDMEQFLIAVRAALLESAQAAEADDTPPHATLAFYAAAARQCFICEYAFFATESETARAQTLRDEIVAALRAGETVPPLKLAAVACMMPLSALAEDERLLARSWPAAIDGLLAQQIREPAEERALRDGIPTLTPIEDVVSVAVRDQYEAHPYPRWVDAPAIEQPVSLDTHVRSLFPLAGSRPVNAGGAVDLLIAGCGTGQIVVNYGRRFVKARVLAVDLSLTSLSYARRKIAALGLKNVEFAQADILKLGAIGRRFDIVNCSGVLHHLGDPLAGWRVLLSLLKPNGVMSVALYSEMARTDYVAAQKLIAAQGYGSSSDDIRRFRNDLIMGPPSKMREGVLGCGDFYTVSACRDLLFHAQEHRFTIPQIKDFVAQNGLTFLGFEIDQAQRRRYSARFPDDRALTGLDNWHAYEQDNPYAFLRMYQFWVQAAA